ncbi:glycosyltransferase family 39 protein [Sphingobium sp.]|uniref:glycosyltransferase family 39 protein n=1 Tax=Sphingobium sp. TaxID=1912891 RepID=UPI002BFFB824|nr:glycosyltransferase family 39 protein [Sphingobium sp.]HUD93377.1 glycosyltransferase family 39 protein [Sphingobium sp.]
MANALDSGITAPTSSEISSGALSTIWLPLCWVALAVGIACRLFSGLDAPLWFDETFSAAIATQQSVARLVAWMLTELSGPTYYTLLWLWEKIAGDGNLALRLPSLILSIATPLVIIWRGHPDRQVRMLWGALTALSIIGFDTATQARPYALLFLFATLQAIAFLRLIDNPRISRAFLWTGISALMVLTHYHSAVICGLQGIAYLAIWRAQAVRAWPALLPLLPMAMWMAWHLPFMLGYAGGDAVWYDKLKPDSLWLIPSLLTGLAWPGVMLLSGMLPSLCHDAATAARGKARWPYTPAETALAGSGMLAILLVMGVGFITPSFTSRYLLPYAPAMLAGVAFWIRRMDRLGPLIAAALLCVMISSAAAQLAGYIRNPKADFRYAFNFEQPSEWIAAQGADRVFMLWDSPTAALDDPDGHLASVGGFFFRRAGSAISVAVPAWQRTGDPNRLLLDLANKAPGSAILWAYDASRGPVHRWRIPTIDPRWQCRDFGIYPITVLACVRRSTSGQSHIDGLHRGHV